MGQDLDLPSNFNKKQYVFKKAVSTTEMSLFPSDVISKNRKILFLNYDRTASMIIIRSVLMGPKYTSKRVPLFRKQ